MWDVLLGILKYVYEEKASFGVVTKNFLVLRKKHFSSFDDQMVFCKVEHSKNFNWLCTLDYQLILTSVSKPC